MKTKLTNRVVCPPLPLPLGRDDFAAILMGLVQQFSTLEARAFRRRCARIVDRLNDGDEVPVRETARILCVDEAAIISAAAMWQAHRTGKPHAIVAGIDSPKRKH